jgi:hypothetical protein
MSNCLRLQSKGSLLQTWAESPIRGIELIDQLIIIIIIITIIYYILKKILKYEHVTNKRYTSVKPTVTYKGADMFLAWPGRKQANVSVRMEWISFGALPCRKKTWWQLVPRCCWNHARPWHASKHVSFLVRLRTYQYPGTWSFSSMVKLITIVNWIPWHPDEHHNSSYPFTADKEHQFLQHIALGMMHKKNRVQ